MNQNFATAREVATAVSSLGYQVCHDTLGAISRNCRDEFLEHLSRCVTSQDNEGNSNKFIGNLLRCLAPETVKRLKAISPGVTNDQIVPHATTKPTRLLSAIDVASNQDHPRHEEAKSYLLSLFAVEPEPAAPPVSAPVARTTVSDTNTVTDKKFHSCHVYGSSYALCFNATEWEGKPGVMVDAAVSNGPKSYDWKNAIHLWLDTNEVGAVLAVFRRWRPSVEFSAHGSQNDKSFSLEFQGQHFFAKLTARKAASHPARAVKILPTDATAVSILFLTQLANSYPAIPVSELLATVRATHQAGAS